MGLAVGSKALAAGWRLTELSFDIVESSNLVRKGPLEGAHIAIELDVASRSVLVARRMGRSVSFQRTSLN